MISAGDVRVPGRACFVMLLACLACDARARDEPPMVDPVGLTNVLRTSALQPGAPTAEVLKAPYVESEWTVYAGQQLYAWLNCVGCHANGGGGIGPPLADAKWIYGEAPHDIFASIWQGRPNGMPAFRGRVAPDQVWALVAYVRAMAHLTAEPLRVDPVPQLAR